MNGTHVIIVFPSSGEIFLPFCLGKSTLRDKAKQTLCTGGEDSNLEWSLKICDIVERVVDQLCDRCLPSGFSQTLSRVAVLNQ